MKGGLFPHGHPHTATIIVRPPYVSARFAGCAYPHTGDRHQKSLVSLERGYAIYVVTAFFARNLVIVIRSDSEQKS